MGTNSSIYEVIIEMINFYNSTVCIVSSYSELTQIVTDVIADPTLPRTDEHQCPK